METLELRSDPCGFEIRAQQEWSLGHSEIVAAFDPQRRVQRVWKRNTMPGRGDISTRSDLRVFRIRDAGVVLRQRRPLADIENFVLRGRMPNALIAPGRLSLTMWLQKANLAVGGRVREPVLDVRERIELLRDVTLQRLADTEVEGLGTVRVYTIYGREPVYANQQNVIVGDMMGMRSMQTSSVHFRLTPASPMNPSLSP